MNSPHAFGALDWLVLAAYAVTLLGIGYHFSRRQRTADEYLLGGRNVGSLLAGISIFAASTSIITYIGTPGEYVQYGPTLAVLAVVASLPFVQLFVGRWLIPVIMRLPITSAYELLQGCLGLAVRRTGSMTCIVSRFVWMAMILFTTSRVLVSMIGCGPHWGYLVMVVIGLVTTTYTLFGGMRTVMITEAIQFSIMLLGATLTIVSISVRLGGVSIWLPRHWEAHWLPQPFFSLNPHIRVTLAGALVYNVLVGIASAGSDQSTIQRFLTTPSAGTARRAFLLGNIAVGGVAILLALVGAALLAFYRLNPQAVPAHLSLAGNGDVFFPLYISQFLPTGISGLVVASLMAMSMSCLSAGINALITIISKDFVETRSAHVERSEREKVRFSRLLAFIIGTAVVVGSVGVGLVRGNIFEVAGKTVDLLGCPLFGLFFMAIFVRFATPFGAIFGAIYSAAAAMVVGYWDVITGQPEISFLWIAPIALATSLSAGCLFSLLPTRGRSAPALAGYAVAALAPVIAAVGWLIARGR